MAEKQLINPEHLGDGVYVHHEPYGIDIAVNHHTNKVVFFFFLTLKSLINYAKKAGILKEDE